MKDSTQWIQWIHASVFYYVLDVAGTAHVLSMQEQHFLALCLRIALLAPSQSWVYWVESICWWNCRVLQRNLIYTIQLQMAGLVYFFTGFHRKNIMWGFPALANSSKSPFPGYLLFLQLRMNGQEVCLLVCLVFYSLRSNWRKPCAHKGPKSFTACKFLFHFYLKTMESFSTFGKATWSPFSILSHLLAGISLWTSLAQVRNLINSIWMFPIVID